MRAFFDLLARFGTTPIPSATFSAEVSTEAARALRTEGIVRRGPLARHFACGGDEASCHRIVRGFDDDDLGIDAASSDSPYVAVCGRDPFACDPVEVTREQLAQDVIARDALVRVLVRAFSLSEPRGVPATEPLFLGESTLDPTPRDVFLVLSPSADLALILLARDREPRPATFFVPNGRGIDAALFSRHGDDAHVELARLDDRVVARGAALAAVARFRALRAVPDPVGEARPLPRLERWNMLRICLVDSETVLLTVDGKNSRRTHVDMGLAMRKSRKPMKPWRLLIAICEGEGRFVWKNFGNYESASRAVSDLRLALKKQLGLDDDPFEVLPDGQGWRPRFEANPEPPKDRLHGGR
jgi:hypothetical protein